MEGFYSLWCATMPKCTVVILIVMEGFYSLRFVVYAMQPVVILIVMEGFYSDALQEELYSPGCNPYCNGRLL